MGRRDTTIRIECDDFHPQLASVLIDWFNETESANSVLPDSGLPAGSLLYIGGTTGNPVVVVKGRADEALDAVRRRLMRMRFPFTLTVSSACIDVTQHPDSIKANRS